MDDHELDAGLIGLRCVHAGLLETVSLDEEECGQLLRIRHVVRRQLQVTWCLPGKQLVAVETQHRYEAILVAEVHE